MSRIRTLRKEKHISQKLLAQLIGADVNLVSRWETGKSKPIHMYVEKLAQALGTSVAYLSGRTDSPTPEPTQENTTVETTRSGFLIFIDGDRRFEIPPTPEGYAMFQRLIDKTIAN